jgi:hypothetical protein
VDFNPEITTGDYKKGIEESPLDIKKLTKGRSVGITDRRSRRCSVVEYDQRTKCDYQK